MNNTQDLAQFGFREKYLAGRLLLAYANNRPDEFNDDEVKVEFNPNSGKVFLLNSDFQVLVLEHEGNEDTTKDKLVMFYSLSEAGSEGTLEDLLTDYSNGNVNEQDIPELKQLAKEHGKKLPKLNTKN